MNNVDTLSIKVHAVDSLHFYLTSFFCAKIPSKVPHDVHWSCRLRLLLAVIVSYPVSVFDDLDSFEYCQGFCRLPLY